MGSVLVVGGINQDLTVQVARRPGAGETVLGSGLRHTGGGKGANQAAAAARAGADVALCAVVGSDRRGEDELADLRARGVDVSRVRIAADTPTGIALIVVTPDGENSIVVEPGANDRLCADDVEALTTGDHYDVVLAQTEPGAAPTDAAAAAARASGARFVLNAAPVIDLAPLTLQAADPLVVNEHEAVDVLRSLGGEHDRATSLGRQVLAAARCRSVVVSLGSRGAQVVEAEEQSVVPSPLLSAVDTTGAGDVLVGVIAAQLASGESLTVATAQACQAAGESVLHHGARPGLPVNDPSAP